MGDYGKNGILVMPLTTTDVGTQPLSESEREFKDSIYNLFNAFKDANIAHISQIRTARNMRKLIDTRQKQNPNDKTYVRYPQLNTLNSTMDNMIADYVDNMPEAVLMSETIGTDEAAQEMTDVVGWVFHHAHLNAEWMDAMEDYVPTGNAVLQDVYDPDEEIGGVKGNIVVERWPAESILFDPYYDDLQQGRAVIKVIVHPRSWFAQHYPDVADYLKNDGKEAADYDTDTAKTYVDETGDDLVCLLEVWYRRYDVKEKRYSVHMAKVAGGCLLEDSRTGFGYPDGKGMPDGVYAHGMYPFTVLRFRKQRGTVYGTGMCYEFADTQDMINRYIRYIDENIRASARFKIILSESAGIDKSQLLDWNKEVVTIQNANVKEGVDWFQPQPLNSLVPSMFNILQDTMKQDSGQNQWTRGEGGQGVTAASAINALQNAGGKISRMHINSMLNEFRIMVERVISMIGQFFDEGRVFAIYGENGTKDAKKVALDKKKMFGSMDAYKKPAFTVRVQPQSSSPDQVEAHNNRVLKIGDIAAQANMPLSPTVLVKMLQMPGKEKFIPILEQSDQMRQTLQQLQQQVEQDQQQLEAYAKQNEQLTQAVQELQQTDQKNKQIMAAVGQQLSAKKAQQQAPAQVQQPSLPQQAAQPNTQTAIKP